MFFRMTQDSVHYIADILLDLQRIFQVESCVVATQSFSDAAITVHADAQMRRRGIDIVAVRAILR